MEGRTDGIILLILKWW